MGVKYLPPCLAKKTIKVLWGIFEESPDLEVTLGFGKLLELDTGDVHPMYVLCTLADEDASEVSEGFIVLLPYLESSNFGFGMPSQVELDFVAVFLILEVDQSHAGNTEDLGNVVATSASDQPPGRDFPGLTVWVDGLDPLELGAEKTHQFYG